MTDIVDDINLARDATIETSKDPSLQMDSHSTWSGAYEMAAPIYFDAGWRSPIPLPAGQKHPPPSGYTGHDGAIPSAEQIAEWCRQRPDDNICLRLPGTVIGIDVDAYGSKTGGQTLAEAETRWGPLPMTFRSTARQDDPTSGIRLFRVPDGTVLVGAISFDDLGIGDIETVQRHHRYTVVWPSRHPTSTYGYQWFGLDGRPLPKGEVPPVAHIPDLPSRWMEALSKDALRHEMFDGSAPNRPKLSDAVINEAVFESLHRLHDTGAPDHHVKVLLDRAIEQLLFGQGSRHDATRDVVMRLMTLHHTGHPGVPKSITQLRDLFILQVADTRSPATAATEFDRMVEGAALLLAAVHLPPSPFGPEGQELDNPRSLFVSGASFVFDSSLEVESIWGSGERVLWADGEGLMIAGAQGVGKTTLAQQLALTLIGVLDHPVLGHAVREESVVLYLAMDRPEQARRALARLCRPEHRALLEERLVVMKGPPPKDLAKHPELLTQLAVEARADVVIVDSLKDAALGLSDDETGSGWNRAVQTLIGTGRNIVVLHHTKKQNGMKVKGIDEIFGSTWLTAGMGSVLMLHGEPGDSILTLQHMKTPAEPCGPLAVTHDKQHGLMTVVEEVDLVRAAQAEMGLTVARAAQLVFDTDNPSRKEVEDARRRLNRLVDRNRLCKGTLDRKTVYWVLGARPTNVAAA